MAGYCFVIGKRILFSGAAFVNIVINVCYVIGLSAHSYSHKGKVKVKVKRTCIAPIVKLQLKALRYGSHRVAPANYTIPAST